MREGLQYVKTSCIEDLMYVCAIKMRSFRNKGDEKRDLSLTLWRRLFTIFMAFIVTFLERSVILSFCETDNINY